MYTSISMLRELRKDDWGKSAKAIILTNLSYDDRESDAEEQGVEEYIVKSNWKISDLVKQVEKIIES